MSKQQIIDYVMNTPGNTNPNVLRSLLDDGPSDNKFIVTLTLVDDDGGIADKSNKEIYEAIQAGKEIWFGGEMDNLMGYFPLAYYTMIEGYQYPFIGTRFDMVGGTDYSSDYVYLIYMVASDTEIYDFSMERYKYEGDSKFNVLLVPTEQGYSGTMDRTPQEITQAYNSGKEIVFQVVGFPGFDLVHIPAAWYTFATGHENCAACATLVDPNTNMQIIIMTSDLDDDRFYSVVLYPLTPES